MNHDLSKYFKPAPAAPFLLFFLAIGIAGLAIAPDHFLASAVGLPFVVAIGLASRLAVAVADWFASVKVNALPVATKPVFSFGAG